jgi:protein tyrosine kinase modulator
MATVQDTPSRGQGLAGMAETLRRRKTLALVPFVLVLVATASLAWFLPSLWTARAVIMVDRQQIPEAFVRSTVSSDIESRLLTLSQDILSRARLTETIDHFNLYPKLRRRVSADELVERMRRDIRIQLNEDEGDRRARDARTSTFSVTYAATDPGVAMQVANRLASHYIADNGQLRERQARGTSDFLESQLAEVRKKLADQEAKITQFKERYLGELPEQREANLRTLDRLQSELQMAQESHRRAVEQRQFMTQTLADLQQSGALVDPAAGAAGPPPSSTTARLVLLRQELAQLLTKYNDKYPDVAYLKDEIAQLEAKAREEQFAAASPGPKRQVKNPTRLLPTNSYVANMMNELDRANVDVKAGTEQIANLQRQMALYQRRIENTPKREHELGLITRDYDTTKELFRSLLAKRGEAGIATELEQRQQGEVFRILDPARLPERPVGPNRLRLFAIGLVLALGASGAAVVLAENVDTSFRRVDEVRARVGVPVLSTIPRITTESDRLRLQRQRRLATAALAFGLLVVVGSSWAVAHDNAELVNLFMPDTGTRR